MRWGKYIKPYLPYFILGPLCMIIEVVGEVLMPKFLSMIVDTEMGEMATNNPYDVAKIAVLMLITAVLMMAGGVGGAYFGAKASVNFATDLRSDIYSKVQKFSFANIDKFSTGSLITRLTNDVTQLQNFVNMMLRMCLRSPGMIIGALIMSLTINPRLTAVLAITMPVLLLLLVFITGQGFPRFAKMQTKIDAVNSTVGENLTNVRVVKSFVREQHEKEKFSRANKNLKMAGMKAMKIMIFTTPVMNFFMHVTTIAIVFLGGKEIMQAARPDTMSVGDLVAFITYINQILMSLMMVAMLFTVASRAMASSKRIREVMNELPDIDDTNATEKERKVTRGDIEFKNVSFRYYKNSVGRVLDDVNLKIKGGSTVGIIGSTGCGKTTLVSLIARLYDADEGEVSVDGVNVREYSLENLREGIGVVLQKNLLFSGTIKENLLWGDENASDAEICSAAQSAQAHDFILNFKDGYDTVLGQGGVNVSGGQKQRLCIARALLKKPKILILDDSTSAVDTATEAEIRRFFARELADTTKIIIAQRISSISDADEIIVMNDGKISGVGTHEYLLRNNADYREIYCSQTDTKEEDVI